LLTHPLALPDWRSSRHEVFYYLYLVTALEQMLFGQSTICESEPDASIQISEAESSKRARSSSRYGVREDSVVAICPGSINSRAKRWPAEAFAALADRLIESRTARCCSSDRKTSWKFHENVTRQMRNQPIVLTGKTSLDQITQCSIELI
jgi:ADP-heptose:LPS heptosyltransferase